MRRTRNLIVAATTVALALGIGAAPASAGWTTFWPSLYHSACGTSDMSGVAGGATKRRGNFGYNRQYTVIYVNGGYWSWGAFYESGSYTNSTKTATGSWSGTHENRYWSTMQVDPFIENRNSSTISASGCFYYP